MIRQRVFWEDVCLLLRRFFTFFLVFVFWLFAIDFFVVHLAAAMVHSESRGRNGNQSGSHNSQYGFHQFSPVELTHLRGTH